MTQTVSQTILAPYNTIVVTRGASKNFSLSVADDLGKAVGLSDAKVYFTVRKRDDTEIVFLKTSDDQTQIQVDNLPKGRAIVFVEAADTQYRDPGEYVYDVWVVILSTGKRYQVVPESPLIIEPAVTFIPI